MYRLRRISENKPDLAPLILAVREWRYLYSTEAHTDTDNTGLPTGPEVHERTISECNQTLEADKAHPVAYTLRGAARWHLGALAPARVDLDEAIRLDPNLPAAHRYHGFVCQALGEFRQAIGDLSEAARLDPENPHNHAALAWLLGSCPDAKLRDLSAAVEYGTLACEMSKWHDPDCLAALAVALAAAGKYSEAVTWQEAALLSPGYRKRCGQDAEKRLKLFADRQPYREQDLREAIQGADQVTR